MADVLLSDAFPRCRELNLDGLVVDQTFTPGATIAELLDLPFVTVCGALPMNFEPGVPPVVTGWSYRDAWWARLRNRAGQSMFEFIARSIRQTINAVRSQHDLAPQTHVEQTYSQLAQISSAPVEFDFPRKQRPPVLHYVGPLKSDGSRPAVEFPWGKLQEGKPLVYASMGTLQNRLQHVFRVIAEACAALDAQVVLSQGGGAPAEANGYAGNIVAVDYAPQLELLKRATLTITHAGMNTTMESLAEGVPMVAIPVTNDQPAVSARIEHSGCGIRVALSKLSVPRLRAAIERVLTEPSYRENALRLQRAIQQAGGVPRAAEIVETVIRTRQPVSTR